MLPWHVGDTVLVKRGIQSIYGANRARAVICDVQHRRGEWQALVRFVSDGVLRWVPCRALVAVES